LPKFPGHEVEICPAVIPDVVLIAKNSILDIARKKNQREELRNHKLLRGQGKPNPRPHLLSAL
jgi:hypothetical protein